MPDAREIDGSGREGEGGAAQRIAGVIFDLIGKVPVSGEPVHDNPPKRSRSIANQTAATAALSAGTLALPPGPLGWLTILPELHTVWKQQAQMVADIAGAYGKDASLTREQMLYCLFGHVAPAVFRDVVIEDGDRVLIRRASPRALRAIVQKIGWRISLRVLGRGVSRWVPLVGAAGVAAYAWRDTGRVAKSAMDLFAREIDSSPQARSAAGGSGTPSSS